MKKIDIIVGGFLGDEGKGKLVGKLGHNYDAVMRVNASTNAGHCVTEGENHFVTRQMPSVFYSARTDLVIAPGALFNLEAFCDELISRPDIKEIYNRVKVASSISLVLKPYIEKDQGKTGDRLESTRQGTGPSASARAMRHSLHLFDIEACVRTPSRYSDILEKLCFTTKEMLPLDFHNNNTALEAYCRTLLDSLIIAFQKIEEAVGNFCVDYTIYASQHLRSDRSLLIEGCNGLLLDNLHGMHPYVTSTSTNIGAMLSGANLSHQLVRDVIVVISAYATCLGRRPFPTEMDKNVSQHFYENCNEIDVAETKKRRIGWLDLPALRKALYGCSGSVLHLNKLDVLTGLDKIKVCTHYCLDEKDIDIMPDNPYLHDKLKAQYEILDGWDASIKECRRFEDLPVQAQDYVKFISNKLSLPITSIGVGPDSKQYLLV